MRILVLAPFAPRADAKHGGARVMAGLMRRLADRNEIALAYLRGPDEPAVDDDLARSFDEIVEVLRPERSPSQRRHAAALLRRRPMWAHDSSLRAYAERTGELARTWKPDVAQLHYQVMAPYHEPTGAPSVLVVHEPMSARAASEASVIEAFMWRRFERSALRRADATVAFTPHDRDVLVALAPEARVEVIPFGVDVPSEPLDPIGDGETVLFVGNFSHAPNVDAARWLATEIFPRVHAERPAARLRLVGAAPTGEVEALASEQVEVAGSIPDVTPELDRAAVVALPLRTGTGMRVKTLEALAAGKAVVATQLALDGISVREGEHVLVAGREPEFAAAIVDVLRNPETRQRLAGRARAWAETNAGWEQPIARHEDLLRSVIAGRGEVRGR